MMRRVLAIMTAALLATTARAQTTGVNQTAVDQAAANGEAQLKENKSNNAPSPAGATVMIGTPLQPQSCAIPVSGGLGNLIVGFTFVWSHSPKSCEARLDAFAWKALGYPAAAVQRLCQIKDNERAMAAAGTPCEAQHR